MSLFLVFLEEGVGSPYWYWLVLGILLLTTELLGTAGYLLWLGLSALLTGIIAWLWPIDWLWQGSSFCLLSLVTVSLWHAYQRRLGDTFQPLLNQPQQQLIGYQATLEAPLINGIGRLQIGDGSWRIQANQSLPVGTSIVVVAIDGITLHVVPATPPLATK